MYFCPFLWVTPRRFLRFLPFPEVHLDARFTIIYIYIYICHPSALQGWKNHEESPCVIQRQGQNLLYILWLPILKIETTNFTAIGTIKWCHDIYKCREGSTLCTPLK